MHTIAENLSQVSILEPQTAFNLTVFPLKTPGNSDLAYLTLADAVAAGLAEVREKSLSGTVAEILLDNRADKPILILDGEELVGAKQNRTVNITILAAAGKTTAIPVTCIEVGRWSSGPTKFDVASRMHYSRGRAMKMENVSDSLAMNESRAADQSEVWDQINRKSERMSVRSATGALSDVFETHSAKVDGYVGKLTVTAGQTGAIFAIDGRVEGLEMFDSPTTFSKMFEKLIRSYALDALETGGQPSADASPTEARALLDTLSQANSQTYPAAGLGQEVRINTDELVAGGLQVDDTLVHLVAFEKQYRDTPSTNRRAAMLRASLRRQNREAN